jgi:Sec-independent protein translocase protein TatA
MAPGLFTQPLDLVILALFAFLVLEPNRFPQLARSAGRWMRETRSAFSSLAVSESGDQPSAAPAGDGAAARRAPTVLAADPHANHVGSTPSPYRDLDAVD